MIKDKRLITFLFCTIISLLFSLPVSADLLIDDNYQLVSKTRASRTEYDYTFKATATNTGEDVEVNVSATLTSSSDFTTVIDGDINFGNVAAESSVTGDDTFTIRQNRSYPFDPSALSWDVTSENLRIVQISSEGGMPGDKISIGYSGAIDEEPIEVIFSGMIASSSVINLNLLQFDVPYDCKSGPLFIRQGNRASNQFFFHNYKLFIQISN